MSNDKGGHIAKGHVVERTSSKGGPFKGVCILCGKEELTMKNARDICENPHGLSQGETLQLAISGPIKPRSAGEKNE